MPLRSKVYIFGQIMECIIFKQLILAHPFCIEIGMSFQCVFGVALNVSVIVI